MDVMFRLRREGAAFARVPAAGGPWLRWCTDVLRYGGYDPDVYSGFAAGIGIDRSTLMRYHIDDIRHFRNNDIRFLEQF